MSAEEREREYEKRWRRGGLGFSAAYTDLLVSKEANDTAAEFFREKIRAIVRDPAVADLLCPQDYPLGTKRLCVDTGYYETFNRDNVTLVDVRKTPDRGHHAEGRARPADASTRSTIIVFATGFDAMTGALLDDRHPRARRPHAATRSGRAARAPISAWPSPGFPNLFMITGPGSPSVLSNMIVSIEQHVDWIADCIDAPARARPATHRGDRGGRGGVGRSTSTRSADMTLYPARELLVHGGQHPGQAAGVHALHRRGRRLPAEVRRGRGQRLRGLRARQIPGVIGSAEIIQSGGGTRERADCEPRREDQEGKPGSKRKERQVRLRADDEVGADRSIRRMAPRLAQS